MRLIKRGNKTKHRKEKDERREEAMKDWQFDVLFWVAVGGAVFLLVAPEIGFDKSLNPTALTGFGAILTYVLTQRGNWTGKKREDNKEDKDEKKEGGE